MSDETAGSSRWWDGVSLAARWVLGGVFIYMGASKTGHPEAFLKLVRQYNLTQDYVVLNSIASMLPWFEIFCGVLLVCGVAVRGVALALAVILVAFTFAVWHRALDLQAIRGIPFCAVKFDCGCGNGEVYICHKLTENFGLIALALWLLAGKGRHWALKYSLGRA